MGGSYSGVAGGNIAPSRFVLRTESSGEPVITQCGTNGDAWGISQPATHRRQFFDSEDGYAAIAGEHVNVLGPGDDEALLEIAGTITAGQPIKSNTDGKGVLADTDKDHVRAVAKQGGVSGQLIKVKPVKYDLAA